MTQPTHDAIKHALSLLVLGASLVIYAHSNFATRDMLSALKAQQDRELDQIHRKLIVIEAKIDKIIIGKSIHD